MKKPVTLTLVAVLLVFAGNACAPVATPALEAPTETGPSAGDTWTRTTDLTVMVYVPEGEFEMGSDKESDEQPVHPVALDAFWIDQTEVTNAQYRQCVEAETCDAPVSLCSYSHIACYGDSDYDDYPVMWVTWAQARAYCEWVGSRLPTEAEWEFAARGPDGQAYPWGDAYDHTKLNSCGARCGYAGDDGYPDTSPVGAFPTGASWCGARDMAGNVSEWVADWYAKYPSERQVNPEGPSDGVGRTTRGGDVQSTPSKMRSSARGAFSPDQALMNLGFRCAKHAE